MNTNVTTSYTTGLTINMGACEMKMFLSGLAINTIAQCREITNERDGSILKSTTKLPHHDDLIEGYCSGVHGAVLSNMLQQNAEILYKFVQDCVLNNTVSGLYLLRDAPRFGEPTWKLILLALDEYMQLQEKEFAMLDKKIPHDFTRYNQYNEQFEKLMEG